MYRCFKLLLTFVLKPSLLFFLAGCYTLQEGGSYLALLMKAKPIKSLQQGELERETAVFFERVQRIRQFAYLELGLKETKNYLNYIELERDYLNQVISASPALALKDYLWDYPLVGKLPYRGYFNEKRLQKEKMRLVKQGYDVLIRKVEAFSTLGYLSDPLFSYMQDYSEYRLANLIIHESLHATIFVKKDTDFNESLASFIGDEGARLYLEKIYGENSPMWQEEQAKLKDAERFRQLLGKLRLSLTNLYARKDLTEREKKEHKSKLFDEFKKDLEENYEDYFSSDSYRRIKDLPLNNAFLNLYGLYYKDEYQAIWQKLYAEEQFSLSKFIVRILQLHQEHAQKLASFLQTTYQDG